MEYKYARFIITIVMHAAKAWDMSISAVYKLLKQTDIIPEYFIKYYDTLHSTGADYMVLDTEIYLKNRDIIIPKG